MHDGYEENLLSRELFGEIPEEQLSLISNHRMHKLVVVPEGVTRKEYLEVCTRLAFRKEQAALSGSRAITNLSTSGGTGFTDYRNRLPQGVLNRE